MPAAHIDIREIDDFEKYLVDREERLEDFSVPLTDVARLMERYVRGAFPSGGQSVGENWAKHADSTIERHGSHQFGQGPTGNLLGGFRIFVRKFVAGVENPMPHAHLFENGRHVLAWVGGSTTRGGLRTSPVRAQGAKVQEGREFMEITDATQQAGIEIILDHVTEE